MNTQLVCFLSVVALAAAIWFHNVCLQRTLRKVRSGQREWRKAAHLRAERFVAKQAELWQARREAMMARALVNAHKRARNLLITDIWGSPTIVRDLSDVAKIVEELRARIAVSERTSNGLAQVVENRERQVSNISTQAEQWKAQAQTNAETLMTLIRNSWAIVADPEKADGEFYFRVCDIGNSMRTLAIDKSPEAALESALQAKLGPETSAF